MDWFKGTLDFYFATGEQPRPQFIRYDACNKDGQIQTYDGVYDIAAGDKIRFLHPALKREAFATVDETFYSFLYWLALMWDQKVVTLDVEYEPAKTTQSWGEQLKKFETLKK